MLYIRHGGGQGLWRREVELFRKLVGQCGIHSCKLIELSGEFRLLLCACRCACRRLLRLRTQYGIEKVKLGWTLLHIRRRRRGGLECSRLLVRLGGANRYAGL